MIPEPRGRLSVLEKGSSAPAVSGLHACATDAGPLSSLEAHSDPAVALCRAIPLQRPGRPAAHDYFIPTACTGASRLDSIVNSGGARKRVPAMKSSQCSWFY